MQSSRDLQFYYMMGYPVPKQESSFLRGVQDTDIMQETLGGISFPEHSFSSEQLQLLQLLQLIRKNIPFLEAVFLTGKHSFDPGSDTSMECICISSQQRMWSCYVTLILSNFIIFCYKKFRKNTSNLHITAILDEQDMKCIHRLKSPDDVMTIYSLAHLTLLYEAYQPSKIHFYQQNTRLKQYLEHFPLEHCINLGPTQHGKTPVKKALESCFSGVSGNIVEKLTKIFFIPLLLLLKKYHLRRRNLQIFSQQIRQEADDQRTATSILWKMLGK